MSDAVRRLGTKHAIGARCGRLFYTLQLSQRTNIKIDLRLYFTLSSLSLTQRYQFHHEHVPHPSALIRQASFPILEFHLRRLWHAVRRRYACLEGMVLCLLFYQSSK